MVVPPNRDREILERHTEGLESDIQNLRNKIAALHGEISEKKCFYQCLGPDGYPSDSLRQKLDSFPEMRSVIDIAASNSENISNLAEHISKQEALLSENKALLSENLGRLDANLARLVRLRELSVSQPGQEDITVSTANAGDPNSGLVYVQARHRIGVSSDQDINNNIGLVVEVSGNGKTTYRVRDDVSSAPACRELEQAWSQLVTATPTGDAFVQTLISMVPHLHEESVKNAWKVSQVEFNLEQTADGTMGEMTFQQLVYTPFSMLFMAAAGGCNSIFYKADESVSSSLSVQCKSKEDDSFIANKISFKPDAAVTLREGRDAFGMMEIKPCKPNNQEPYLTDNDKCVLMTAITAIAVGRCIRKEQYRDVALPFVIATGTLCYLYVTTLDENGRPCIRLVGYPDDDGQSGHRDCSKSPSDQRMKLFVALAILLNKFKAFFKSEAEASYNRLIPGIGEKVKNLPTRRFSSSTSLKRKKSGSSNRAGSNRQSGISETEEMAAKEAAACGGKFCNVVYPFDRFLRFTESRAVMDVQKKSPFYFKGRPASADMGATTKEVFLKVWKLEDIDFASVEMERRYHQEAFEAGVPVAAPVFPEIARSRSTCGSEYLVFAVEYIHDDFVANSGDFFQFCRSLIDTVMKLHSKAGMLHCDLKPDNIRWSNGVVRLIDFGHAQSISEATWVPGTQGFEAPEILNRMPCSTKTDAFSVGRIILEVLEMLQEGGWLQEKNQQPLICSILHHIAENLADSDPDTRWSLTKASNELRRLQRNKGATVEGENRNETSPPNKVAKLGENSLIAYPCSSLG